MERVAQCHCGSLHAIASGEPVSSYLCHCKACQRRTGTVVHARAYFLTKNARFEGDDKVHPRVADTGFGVDCHFCPNCGTTVYWVSDKRPDYRGIAVGCFADPTLPAPPRSTWEASKHPWLGLPSDMVYQQWDAYADGTPMGR